MNLYDAYNKCNDQIKKSIGDLLNNMYKEKATRYIQNYFNDRGKRDAFNFDNKSELLNKSIHTISVFLLGFILQDIVTDELKKYLDKAIPSWKDWDFEYTWFLTSLYHDNYSGYEKKIFKDYKKYDMKSLLRKVNHNYQYSMYDKNLSNTILGGEKKLPYYKPM